MVDKFSKEVRSHIMSKLQRNSKPEQVLRKALFKKGYRYSLKHRFKEIRCTPDIVMVSRKVCIFVDGCFWHKCPKCYKPPKSNKRYWKPKLDRNVERDKEQNNWLRKHGWNVIRVWEHEVKNNLLSVIRIVEQKL